MTNRNLKYVPALVLVLAGLLFYMTNMPGKSHSDVEKMSLRIRNLHVFECHRLDSPENVYNELVHRRERAVDRGDGRPSLLSQFSGGQSAQTVVSDNLHAVHDQILLGKGHLWWHEVRGFDLKVTLVS